MINEIDCVDLAAPAPWWGTVKVVGRREVEGLSLSRRAVAEERKDEL
jgi:hypothetical protein